MALTNRGGRGQLIEHRHVAFEPPGREHGYVLERSRLLDRYDAPATISIRLGACIWHSAWRLSPSDQPRAPVLAPK